MSFGLEHEGWEVCHSHGAGMESILFEAGRGINAETCVLDDLFPLDDLSSSS